MARRIFAHVLTLLTLAVLCLWQSGHSAVGVAGDLSVKGLGFFAMNLLAPIIPLGRSTLFREDPVNMASQWQYEGYAYLGAGVLLMGVLALLRLVWSARRFR